LLVRSDDRRKARLGAGKTESPIKVTISGTGDLDPSSKFFSTGDVEKIVYVPTSAATKANEQVGKVGTVVDAGETMQLDQVVPRPREARGHSPDGRGRRHDAHAIPVGRPRGRDPPRGCPLLRRRRHRSRFVNDAAFPQNPSNRMTLAEVHQIGDVVLLRYLPKAATND